MPESRLLLLDGHSLAYRAFYALPVENFSTTTGQPTNAVFGFTSMLINVLRDERPTHVAVAFDVSRQTFRTESFPEYKANRASSPAEFAGQVDLIREVLAALGIPVLSIDGYEADDIIATLVRRSADRDMTVDIVTGDRDAFQLVSDRVTVLYPVKGVSDLARMTPASVEEKYGLHAGPVPRLRRPAGRPERQPAGHPGRGGEDRREVDPRVRLARGARGPCRPGGRQGRRRAAGGAAAGARQPAPHPARRRRARAARPRRGRARPLGPLGGRPALRHPPVPGPARAARQGAPRLRRRAGGSRRRHRAARRRDPRPGRCGGGRAGSPPRWACRRSPWRAPGRGAAGWSTPLPSSTTAESSATSTARMRRRPRPCSTGWPTPRRPRTSTTPRARPSRSSRRAGSSRASASTPPSPPTWRRPAIAATGCPTSPSGSSA